VALYGERRGKLVGDSALDTLVKQFGEALRLEIEYQQEEGGKGYVALDGQLLAEGTVGFLYSLS